MNGHDLAHWFTPSTMTGMEIGPHNDHWTHRENALRCMRRAYPNNHSRTPYKLLWGFFPMACAPIFGQGRAPSDSI